MTSVPLIKRKNVSHVLYVFSMSAQHSQSLGFCLFNRFICRRQRRIRGAIVMPVIPHFALTSSAFVSAKINYILLEFPAYGLRSITSVHLHLTVHTPPQFHCQSPGCGPF